MGKNGESLSKEKRLTLCISQAMFDKLAEQAKSEDTSVSAYVRKSYAKKGTCKQSKSQNGRALT